MPLKDAEYAQAPAPAPTTPQAAALDKLLADLGTALDIVMELVVDDDEVIRRLSGRRTCRGCGKIWHVEFDPTSKENICDRCGSELFQRDDDKAETIANRLVEYADKTAPLIDYYTERDKLRRVDGDGGVRQRARPHAGGRAVRVAGDEQRGVDNNNIIRHGNRRRHGQLLCSG